MPAELPAGEAHLFLVEAPETLPADVVTEYERLITPVERERYLAFRFERHRYSFLLTRALVRLVLSSYTGVSPAAWRFRLGSHGKPEIESPAPSLPLSFNLSNTDGMVVCLVARDVAVGVDVEHSERDGELSSIAEHFFSPREVSSLREVGPERLKERFFAYWTLKEAYIKAHGLGLAIPLDQFSFVLDKPIRIETDPRLNDDPSCWQFGRVPLDGPHALAYAIQRGARPDFSVSLRSCAATRIESFFR
jgi:4'-phosphopantetheinyl transferase